MSISIVDVWLRLGGPEPRGKRAAAWWRESKDRNISLDGERWYDFARSVGGGPSELVQHVLNIDNRSAFRWLVYQGLVDGARRPSSNTQTIKDFSSGLQLRLDALLQSWKQLACGVPLDSDEAKEIAEKIGNLTRLEADFKQNPAEVYEAIRERFPKDARRLVRSGKENRIHAELLAAAAIRMLEQTV